MEFRRVLFRSVKQVHIGDTVTVPGDQAAAALPGYKPPQRMVYCGLYPSEGENFEELRDALEKLAINDPSFEYQPESSEALGFGFRCGFLGLLHMEIIQQRLEQEADLDLVQTAPNVTYQILKSDGTTVEITRGEARERGAVYEIIDTPGVYSLLPMSEDERVTRDILMREPGARVLQVCDAKNMRRSLMITIQLAEMGVPLVLAANMADEARELGIDCEIALLGGIASDELLRQADDFSASLMLLGAGADQDSLGSTALRVLRSAKCPVLTTRPAAHG